MTGPYSSGPAPRIAPLGQRTLVLAVLMVAASVPQLSAQALIGFTGGTAANSVENDGDTIGWSFTTSQRFVLTHLGYWDGDFATLPLTISHPVGLWTDSGDLLAESIVQAASPRTGDWRYVAAAHHVLAPGTYRIGAFVPANNPSADSYRHGAESWTMASGFTMGETMRDPNGVRSGLEFPSVATAAGGRFGPNLRFTTPEPGIALAMTATADMRTYACGTVEQLTLPPGSDLAICYTVENTGNANLTRHNLVDSRLGAVLSDFPFVLAPEAQAFLLQLSSMPAAGAWSATWTAYNPGPFESSVAVDALGVQPGAPVLACNGDTVTFSSGFPAGVSSFDARAFPGGDNSSVDFWNLASCGEAGNWTGARGDVACASSDAGPAGPYDTQLRTHSFSLEGQASAVIEFSLNYQDGADNFALEASTNGGLNWSVLQAFAGSWGALREESGVRLAVPLTPYLDLPSVRLRWRYTNSGAGASDLYAQVDNIALICGDGLFFDSFESADTHAWSAAAE